MQTRGSRKGVGNFLTGNIIDYLKEYGNKSFAEHPFGEVDVLLLAQLSYLKFDGVVPTIAEHRKAVTMEEIAQRMVPEQVFADKWYEKQNRELWSTLLECERYRTMGCNYYRSRTEAENETQFGAMTFFPEGCDPVVAFRGTDDSLIGWKEDFNLAFLRPLPSQKMSAVYLNQVSCNVPGTFIVCGHSKGGNLAVFASIWADSGVQNKITDVYSLDGPGFLPEILSGDSYERIRNRVHRILPYSSLVGMLLQNYERYEVVKSTAFGVMQHDCYTWEIADGALVKAPDIEEKQKRMNEVLNRWIFTLPEEDREMFVNTLFEVIGRTKATTLPEFADDWKNNFKVCLHHLRGLDADTRRHIRQILKVLIEVYTSVMGNAMKQELKKSGNKDHLSH